VQIYLDPIANSGSCQPTDEHAFPAPSWTNRLRACSGASAVEGCATDELCLPRPPEALGSTLCIWRAADAACPAGYGARNQYYRGQEDGRTCTTCSCAAPSGATCGGSATLHPGSCPTGGGICTINCNPPVVVPGECQASADFANAAVVIGTASGGTCRPSGSTPGGDVTPTDIVTVCCQ
jgi:hypothetical protein